MPAPDQDSSGKYHDDNPHDPRVQDHNRAHVEDDYWACMACSCNDLFGTECRCSCHSQRVHH